MKPSQLKKILDRHAKWLRGEEGGERANLVDANLRGAKLESANLERANLAATNLVGANLESANLERANLVGANLEGANLESADLEAANLYRANLEAANIEAANLERADLESANLERANLAATNLVGANLYRANLESADLEAANLEAANLEAANLYRANLEAANLVDANLERANFVGANLEGANLKDANRPTEATAAARTPEEIADRQSKRAARYRKRHPEVPFVEGLDRKILDLVTSGRGELKMSSWHTCATTHCRAGWAVTLAGEEGKRLEEQIGPYRAGLKIYLASTGRVPHFFASDERAMEDIRQCAAEQSIPIKKG